MARRDSAELTVVYRDPWLLVADKPQGVLVHGDGTGAPTLSDAVRDATRRAGGDPSQVQAVNRLDVPTSGLVLFSLDKGVQPQLDALVAGHDARKRYLALVRGSFPRRELVIDAPIARDRHDARRMRVAAGGKPARTLVTCLAREGGYSLLGVELQTGRKHQIRVHLASEGWPIVGDELYHGARSRAGLMLHAWELAFVHPVTGEALELRSAWPARFPEPPEGLG